MGMGAGAACHCSQRFSGPHAPAPFSTEACHCAFSPCSCFRGPSVCRLPSPLAFRSFNTSKRVVDEMVVSLARCTRCAGPVRCCLPCPWHPRGCLAWGEKVRHWRAARAALGAASTLVEFMHHLCSLRAIAGCDRFSGPAAFLQTIRPLRFLAARRPKLKIAADVVLGRRSAAETTPRTFCSFDQISPEALELVEG